ISKSANREIRESAIGKSSFSQINNEISRSVFNGKTKTLRYGKSTLTRTVHRQIGGLPQHARSRSADRSQHIIRKDTHASLAVQSVAPHYGWTFRRVLCRR